MNRLIALLCGLTLAVCTPLFGQNRDFQAQRLVLDDDGTDGGRNTMTLQPPSILPLNTIISIPNPGLPGASFLLTESLAPQSVNANITFTGTVDFTTSTVIGLNSLTDGTTLLGTGIPLNRFRLNMAHPNNWIAPQNFNAVDVDGGTIDGTSIGGTTPSSGVFTTLSSSGTTQLGNGVGPDNLTISLGTGNLTVTGLQSDNSPTAVLTYNGSSQVRATSIAALAAAVGASTAVVTDGTLSGDGSVGSPLGIDLSGSNAWTAEQTFADADVNGGEIDGTPIGGTTPAGGAFTLLTSNGATTLGDGNGDNITLDVSDPITGGNLLLDVTNGTLEIDGLTQDNALADILVVDAGGVVHTRSVASIGGGGSGWSLSGNGGTTAGTDFFGTTDNVALVVKTNNSERIRILGSGEVGIGATAPSQKLEVRDGHILLSSTGSAGELRLAEPGGTDYTAFRATAQAAPITYTLPPADGTDGNVLATDGSGVLTWVNPNQSGAVGSELFAGKGGDETITNNGTLQNDDDLVLAMEASTTYSVEGFLYVKANVNNADINIGFTVPTGSAMKMTYVAYDGANNIKGGGFVTTSGTASGAIDVNTSTTTDIAIWFRGIVRVSTTAGNLQLQWAQNAPGGGRSTTVEHDSFMEAKRVQ